MSSAEAFPLSLPGDARRAFASDDVTRRVARIAGWAKGSRVLDLACGDAAASLVLAREFGCQVLAADSDEGRLAAVREKVRAAGLQDRIDVRQVDFAKLPFGDEAFEGILIQGRVPLALGQLGQLRRHLAPSGRLAITYPVRVGRFSAKASLDHWEARLGEPLKLPRELLAALELEGFEPESVETASDAELAELFRALEPQLDGPSPVREELELHQAAGGKPGTSFALAIVRRKEAGEKPPVSRDRG